MTLEHISIQMQEEEQARVHALLADVFRLGGSKKTTPTQDRQTLAISMECLKEATERVTEWAANHGLSIEVDLQVKATITPERALQHIVVTHKATSVL